MTRRRRRRDPVAQERWELEIWRSLTWRQLQQPKWQRRIEGWRRVWLHTEAGLPPPGDAIPYADLLSCPPGVTQTPKRRRRWPRDPARQREVEVDALVLSSASEQGDADRQNGGTQPGSPEGEPVSLPWSTPGNSGDEPRTPN